ncbi:MAG: hypothetical protein V3V96_14365 [Acidiferrobacterales bacterium]
MFDLIEYAKRHRYRLRNLNDGEPVPPARRKKAHGGIPAYRGEDDRDNAIVGHAGYVADDGEPGLLSIFLSYKTPNGLNRIIPRVKALGGRIKQLGDTELTATFPTERLLSALQIIKVCKLPPPGDPQNLPERPSQAVKLGLETAQRAER